MKKENEKIIEKKENHDPIAEMRKYLATFQQTRSDIIDKIRTAETEYLKHILDVMSVMIYFSPSEIQAIIDEQLIVREQLKKDNEDEE